ncbi:MAG: hypothetical protein R3Y23_01340 [Bacillota bacterium]
MAQNKITQHQMFNASWTERDEAVLIDLLHRKIGELKYEIKDAESPMERHHLHGLRDRYKAMYRKVKSGDYDNNILAAELASAKVYRQGLSTSAKSKSGASNDRYADSYADINFDYDKYFAKSRYYGTSVPLISLILIGVFLFLAVCGSFLTTDVLDAFSYQLEFNSDSRLTLDSIAYFKISEGEDDFYVPNDGDWPSGTFTNEEEAIAYGTLYVDESGKTPDYVYLAADLGMNTINVSTIEVIRAVFRMSFLSDTRLDFIEDLESMDGRSWYYYKYISTNEDNLVFEKDINGDYDWAALVRIIATYGTIICLCLMIIFAIIELLMNIGRLFSFTTRRLHAMPILILITGALTLVLPALLEIEVLDMANISACFSNYFGTSWSTFITVSDTNTSTITFSLLFALYLIIPLVVLILPKLFHNKSKKLVRYVPKGNKPHTFPGQIHPTRAGDPVPSSIMEPKDIQKAKEKRAKEQAKQAKAAKKAQKAQKAKASQKVKK